MSSHKYCLDTHVLLWYFTQESSLSAVAKNTLDEIFAGKSNATIPSIVLLEIFHISRRNRKVVFVKFLKPLRIPNVSLASLNASVLRYCYQLPKSLEIHDRIIVATALATKTILITKDPELKALDMIKTIW